jgi:hypothetical protein
MRELGLNPHKELRDIFIKSREVFSWFLDGKLMGMGGIIGTLVSNSVHVWIAVSQEGLRYPREFLTICNNGLSWLKTSHDEITATVMSHDETAVRYIRKLGFVKVFGNDCPEGQEIYRWRKPVPGGVTTPVLVLGLPRSRTTWLSVFLSYAGWDFYHDMLVDVDSTEDLVNRLRMPKTGTVETGMARAFHFLADELGELRVVVVKRPIGEVAESASKFGWEFPAGYLQEESNRLDAISKLPGVLTVNYADLPEEATCAEVFEFCLDLPFDRAWWADLAKQNIQINMQDRWNRLAIRQDHIASVIDELCAHVTIQEESVAALQADGSECFRLHYEDAGTVPELPPDINWDLYKAHERLGYLQVVTARTFSGVVGYLVFLINPSYESKDALIGYQNTFFVRKEFRGKLGLKMHKYAREKLAAKGVKQLILRAGVRGNGDKQTYLFERLGAKCIGSLYALSLE